MSIKLAQESYVAGPKEIEIPNGTESLKLFVHELGYLRVQEISIEGIKNNKSILTSLVAESVKDKDGNQFNYEELLLLKKDIAEILQQEVIKVNGLQEEKK